MTGIRRVSQLGTTGESTYVDGSIQAVDIAANVITQDKLSTDIPLSGFRNIVINGGFDIWQRGTSAAFTTTVLSSFQADRWSCYRSVTGADATQSRISSGLDGFQYALRMQRNNGTAGTQKMYIGTSFEASTATKLINKPMVLSFYARAGANYSPASSGLEVLLQSGTGTEVNGVYTGFTSGTNVINTTATLTTSWQRFTYYGVMPATSSQLLVQFAFNSVGTAGANDYADITGVQLETGTQPTPFEQRPIGTELALCQRYFHVIPAGNIKAVNQYATVGLSGGNLLVSHTFPVTMRADPTAYTSGGSGSHSFDFYQSSAGSGIARVLVYQSGQSTTTIGFKTLAYSSDNNGGNLLPSNGHLIGILNTAVWVSAEL